jgi:predicted RNA-binding protein with PIN domain
MGARPCLIVDGYNVLSADPAYRALADRDIDSARARLVDAVAGVSAGRYRATVVFDGGGNPTSDGKPRHVAGLAIIFSAAGQDADAVIEALVRRARERGEEVVVATSDAQTQWAVLGPGVRRMSSRELLSDLEANREEWGAHSASGRTGGTVEERVDPSTRDALFRWARGG